MQRTSKNIIIGLAAVSLGALLWQPVGPLAWALDVAMHTYLGFLGTVMAHEASHGHLGRGRSNIRWGRLALLPILVPFANFRRTHPLHHAFTNDPHRDPDRFIEPAWSKLEIPFRAVLMPHQWFFWLRARGRMQRKDLTELATDYAIIAAVWAPLIAIAGPLRVAATLVPALVLVSCLLWYPFAFKTHEGFSMGGDETRSHDYYGKLLYWFSLGLSMHRAHHLHPELTWLELRAHVKPKPPARGLRRLLPQRDVVRAA